MPIKLCCLPQNIKNRKIKHNIFIGVCWQLLKTTSQSILINN